MIETTVMLRRRSQRIILLGLFAVGLPGATPPLRYLGDINLGMPGEPRTSLAFGRAWAVLSKDGHVRFQGHDDRGKFWQAVLPISEGVGFTTVWQADFDHNSRSDLLVASQASQIGHCINEPTLSFLLFDRGGQPVPWVITARTPAYRRFPPEPALFAESNGKAELVATGCDWIQNTSGGEDTSVRGIYQAQDTTWHLVRPENLAPYATLVRRRYGLRRNVDRLLPASPDQWPDEGNSLHPGDKHLRQITSVLTRSPSCLGVRLPPVVEVDGQLQLDSNWKDPCNAIGEDRLLLSDGTTCYGWPTVMIDRQNGRQIVAATEKHDLERLLRQIADEKLSVLLAGQKEPGRCSPVLLWARDPK